MPPPPAWSYVPAQQTDQLTPNHFTQNTRPLSTSFYPECLPHIFIILPRILSLHHFTIILPRMLTSFSASCPQTTPRRSRSAGDLRLYTPALTSQSGWTEVAWGCPRAHASTLRRMTGFRRRRLVTFRLGELSRTPRWTSITV